jgi:chorismate mutase
MSNQSSFNSIKEFRLQIDAIDRQVISLLKQRMSIIKQVAEYKKMQKEVFFIKSSREADMIKKLATENNSNFSTASIVSIWRKIITNANMFEQEIKLVLHNPKKVVDFEYILRDYYNNEIDIQHFDSANSVIAEVEKDHSKIAVFAVPNQQTTTSNINEDWWINLAHNRSNLRVYATLPFVKFINKPTQHQLVAVASKDAEQSMQDVTLLVCELDKQHSIQKISALFSEQKLDFSLLKVNQSPQFGNMQLALFKIEGFFLENSPEIVNIANSNLKPYIKIIGNYPVPIEL